MMHCVIWPSRSMGVVFAHHLAALGHPPTDDDFVNFGFEDLVKKYYEQNRAIVPTLNDRPLDFLPASCLIRIRGMLQEIKDPEFYIASYTVHDSIVHTTTKKTTKYQEVVDCANYLKQTFDQNNMHQRTPGYLIPIPCETGWARARAHPRVAENNFYKHLSRKKNDIAMSDNVLPAPSARVKRGREEFVREVPANVSGPRVQLHLPLESPENVAAVSQKKFDELDNTDLTTPALPIGKIDDGPIHRIGRDFNFPVPNNFGVACWAKFYPPFEARPNQLVDCIGVYSPAPSESRDFKHNDASIESIPAPYAPRFHAICVEDIGEGHPLIPTDPALAMERRDWIFQQLGAAREALISWMAMVLGGDTLAAEYLLSAIIARPFRREEEGATGHIPLNLTGCEPVEEFIASNQVDDVNNSMDTSTEATLRRPDWWTSVRGRVEYLLENLVVRRHTIPLTQAYLKRRSLSPRFCSESDTLLSAELQLPPNTVVVIDETQLDHALEVSARQQLEELSSFIHHQNVHYDFTNYKLPFPVDCPTVILSQNGNSRFAVACSLPIQCDLSIAPPTEVDNGTLDVWRTMIGIFRMTEWPDQSPEVLNAIQDDFCAIRNMPGNEYLTPELFSHWNALAVASAISNGELQLTEDRWTQIKAMESERLSRH